MIFKCSRLIFFSGLRPEITYFPDAAHPAKTCFLATAAKKFYTTLGHKQKMTQIAVYHILGFASEGNLRAIWAILYFSGLGS